MRNVFDQYSQTENKVTHALITALNEDRRLLAEFLDTIVEVEPPTSVEELHVLEQRFPGGAEHIEAELDQHGIPDAWIHDEDGWCVVIESKVTAAFRRSQIDAHARTARRRGFSKVVLVSITTERVVLGSLHRSIRWRDVYVWLHERRLDHPWAERAAAFLEITEARLIQLGVFTGGTLTMFTGFPFGEEHPYTYLEAKRLLGLAMEELRTDPRLHRLGVAPTVEGRAAIRGSKDKRVWDLLQLAPTGSAFTNAPHLTMGIHEDWVEAMVTFPNGIDRTIRRRIAQIGAIGFGDLITKVVAQMSSIQARIPGTVPWFRVVQRRYRTQTIVRAVDATLEFDLRTAIETLEGPKHMPGWLQAGYEAYVRARPANCQMQIGAQFRYADCPELREPTVIGALADAWLACSPVLTLAMPEMNQSRSS